MSHPTGIPYDLEIDGTITRRDGKTVYLLTSGQVVDQPYADDVLEHWRSVPAFLAGKAEREPRRFTRTTGDDDVDKWLACRDVLTTETPASDPLINIAVGGVAGGLSFALIIVEPAFWFVSLWLAAISGWASRGYHLTITRLGEDVHD